MLEAVTISITIVTIFTNVPIISLGC